MTSLRLVAGIAVGVALAAFALGSGRLGALSETPAAAAPAPDPARASPVFPAEAPPAAPLPARATAPAARPARAPQDAPARPHVAAGVLARAASARKQERAATCPEPSAASGDGVESIEIDWNAPPADP